MSAAQCSRSHRAWSWRPASTTRAELARCRRCDRRIGLSSDFGPRSRHLRRRHTPTPAGRGHDLFQTWQTHQGARRLWRNGAAHRGLWIPGVGWPTLHSGRGETHHRHASCRAGTPGRLGRIARACAPFGAPAPISGAGFSTRRTPWRTGTVQPLAASASTTRSSPPVLATRLIPHTTAERSRPGPQGVQARLNSPASISSIVGVSIATTIVPSSLTLRTPTWRSLCCGQSVTTLGLRQLQGVSKILAGVATISGVEGRARRG